MTNEDALDVLKVVALWVAYQGKGTQDEHVENQQPTCQKMIDELRLLLQKNSAEFDAVLFGRRSR